MTRLVLTTAVATLLLAPASAAAAGTPAACDDLLVTFTREGVTGDDRAVALTAQSIGRDVAGWDMVAWDSAEGTQLTRVIATDRAGKVRNLAPEATGVAERITELTFCGTTTPAADADAGAEERAEDTDPDAEAEERTHDAGRDTATGAPDKDSAGDAETPTAEVGSRDDTAAVVEADDAEGVDATTAIDADAAGAVTRAHDRADGDTADTGARRSSATMDASAPDEVDAAAGSSDGTATGDQRASGSTEDDEETVADEETEVLGVRIVASPEVEDDTADGADDATDDDLLDDAAATTHASASQAALAATGARSGLGLLDSAWLLLAVIAAGIAAGVGAVRYRTATPAGANDTSSHHAGADSAGAGLNGGDHR